jgi:cytochrome c
LLGELKGHGWGVTQLAATTDGKRLISTGTDATVRIWDVASQTESAQLIGHEGPVFGLSITRNGREAVTVDRYGILQHWRLDTAPSRGSLKVHDKAAWAVAFTPDGRFVVTGGSDETARVWHLETGDRIGTTIKNDTEAKPWLTSKHPGARLFRKCARCHDVRADARRRSGPHFEGLIGRQAGSVERYKYSAALRNVSYRWTRKNIAGLFREGPDVFLPGTKMPMQKILDPSELDDLIDYIDELTRKPR